MPTAAYDVIGRRYAAGRRPEPRIAEAIQRALGDASSVVNVGAGTGSYEPQDRLVVALEPSSVMVAQRVPGAAPAVMALAEAMPFPDAAFDAAMAVLTMHHWSDAAAGLREMGRVASRIVVLTVDPAVTGAYWLVERYFPRIARWDETHFPSIGSLRAELPGAAVEPVPVPAACRDGFLAAYWRRPEAYLDPDVRACISTFSVLGERELDDGLRRLRAELASGEWRARYGRLLDLDELDCGYRLVAGSARRRV
jgi:SAM-dependent methyltransferase